MDVPTKSNDLTLNRFYCNQSFNYFFQMRQKLSKVKFFRGNRNRFKSWLFSNIVSTMRLIAVRYQYRDFFCENKMSIKPKNGQTKRQHQSIPSRVFVGQKQQKTQIKSNLRGAYFLSKLDQCKRAREQCSQYKQREFKQIIIILQEGMKLKGPFDYYLNIEKELVWNHQNLVALFEQKFEKDIQAQKNLILNNLIDADFKQICLQYIKSPEMRLFMKREVQKNTFISRFLNFSHEHQKNKPCFDDLLTKMNEKLQKKSNNSNQPLTFYNEYVELSNKIQSCFILKKGIRDQEGPEDEHLALMDGKCGLKMKKHHILYRYTFLCDYCNRGFKNQSGLKSHENTCKMAEKVKSAVEKRRQTCHRKSKRIFKTLDEERIHT